MRVRDVFDRLGNGGREISCVDAGTRGECKEECERGGDGDARGDEEGEEELTDAGWTVDL